jgi:hypothetical protein
MRLAAASRVSFRYRRCSPAGCAAVGVAALLLCCTGCATQGVTIALDDPVAVANGRLTRPEGRAISAYTVTGEHTRRGFEGRARVVGDSIVLWTKASQPWGFEPGRRATEVRMPTARVSTVQVPRAVPGHVYAAVGLATAAAVLWVVSHGIWL